MASNQSILISELAPGWNDPERLQLRAGVGALGAQSDAQPANINHSRVSLDNTQMIFQALFEDEEITRDNIVATIAVALVLPEAAVNAKIDYMVFDPWPAVRDYIATNTAEWDVPLA